MCPDGPQYSQWQSDQKQSSGAVKYMAKARNLTVVFRLANYPEWTTNLQNSAFLLSRLKDAFSLVILPKFPLNP